MIGPSRTDTSIVGSWWWTVDRMSLVVFILLMVAGLILVIAASPTIAVSRELDSYHFVQRQIIFLIPAVIILLSISMISPEHVRRLGIIVFIFAIILVLATFIVGEEVNGAKRWIRIGGLGIQPSELLKPSFVIVTAWVLAAQQRSADPNIRWISILFLMSVCCLLVLQPDIGMTALIIATWFIQFFVAGMSFRWIGIMLVAGITSALLAYAFIPHVTERIDSFLFPEIGDNFQLDKSIAAFNAGGPFGKGPGEGTIKIPDAHTDFIFAVAGEEFGLLACLAIASAFAFLVLRTLFRLMRETDYFILLAGSGLIVQFGLQAAINIGVNLRLLPAKGMTLPFISYGGSSLLAIAFGMGMLLALTRRRISSLESRWILGRSVL